VTRMLSEVDAMPLDLTPESDAKRREVLSLLADALCDAGRCGEADGVRAIITRKCVPQYGSYGHAWWNPDRSWDGVERVQAARISTGAIGLLTGHGTGTSEFKAFLTISEAVLSLAKVAGQGVLI
jgi:hypothetical protein